MPIEDVFSISGRGTVVTAASSAGKIKVGEEVEIVGCATRRSRVHGRLKCPQAAGRGCGGRQCGLPAARIDKDSVERGQVLCKPGSVKRTRSSGRSLHSDQGRGRAAHAVLQQLTARSSTSARLT